MRRAVLEFINERDGERIVHGRLLDAYDAWTCTEQLKEAMSYQALAERREFDPVDVPRREKTLLLAAPDSTRLTELGSSVLEAIDGFEAVTALFDRLEPGHGRELRAALDLLASTE